MTDKQSKVIDAYLESHTPNARFESLCTEWSALPNNELKKMIYELYIQRYKPESFFGIGALHHLSKFRLALNEASDNAAKSHGGLKGAATKRAEKAPMVERAEKEWNRLDKLGIGPRGRAAIIASTIGVTPQTARKYLKQAGII